MSKVNTGVIVVLIVVPLIGIVVMVLTYLHTRNKKYPEDEYMKQARKKAGDEKYMDTLVEHRKKNLDISRMTTYGQIRTVMNPNPNVKNVVNRSNDISPVSNIVVGDYITEQHKKIERKKKERKRQNKFAQEQEQERLKIEQAKQREHLMMIEQTKQRERFYRENRRKQIMKNKQRYMRILPN